MTYILLNGSMELVITKSDTIYCGDNMADAITFLLPLTVGDLDISTSTVYLTYVRPDGEPDIVILERSESMYDKYHYQYIFPVSCKLSRYPGTVTMWLNIYNGDIATPINRQSDSCNIKIRESKNIDGCIGNHQLTALYQLQKNLEAVSERHDTDCAWSDIDGSESGESSTDWGDM